MAHLADYNTDRQFKALVKNTKRLTPPQTDEVREILLEVQQPGFDCQVDQSFGVLLRSDGAFGNVVPSSPL